MYRFLGIIAAVSQWLNRIRLNRIPLDVGLLVALPIVCFVAFAIAQGRAGVSPWIVFAGSAVAWISLVQSRLRHDLVFRSDGKGAIGTGGNEGAGPNQQLTGSGRFQLWKGNRSTFLRVLDRLMSGTSDDRWFFQVPVAFATETTKPNLFAFTALLDISQRFLGIPLEHKTGVWILDGTFDSVEQVENGRLYIGRKTLLALRIRFMNAKGRRRVIVLSFNCSQARDEFRQAFQSGAHGQGVG